MSRDHHGKTLQEQIAEGIEQLKAKVKEDKEAKSRLAQLADKVKEVFVPKEPVDPLTNEYEPGRVQRQLFDAPKKPLPIPVDPATIPSKRYRPIAEAPSIVADVHQQYPNDLDWLFRDGPGQAPVTPFRKMAPLPYE